MITIVDYGLGNILAFANIYKQLNIKIRIAKQAEDLKPASKLILPGVGAFDHAMQLLDQSGMRQMLDKLVLEEHIPILGICVGMQILARSSDEGRLSGLNWIDGRVSALKSLGISNQLPLPHMGWNDVRSVVKNKLFEQLEANARFYFLHSYYFECDRKQNVIAVANYGKEFSCAVNAGNIYGVQFHPEKSHSFGIQLLKNFADL
jgi:glutamine amidotransferase